VFILARKRQSFLYGAIILMATTIIVKVIGAIFKIPLANLIGGAGMGYFTTAYGLYTIIYVLATAGFPVAVSRMVAESASKGRFKDARRALKVATITFSFTGTVGTVLMLIFSKAFVNLIGNPGAYWCIVVMSPIIFFGTLMSAQRGYYEGLQNMFPTGISQVIEAMGKLIFGYFCAIFIVHSATTEFNSFGTVFHKPVTSLKDAQDIYMPFAAAGAMLGVTIGSFLASVFVILRHKIKGDGITDKELLAPQHTFSNLQIFKKLLKTAIPVAVGAGVLQLAGAIDLVSVMNRLTTALNHNSGTLLKMYEGNIPIEKLDSVPNYLWGCYQGMAVTMFNLVPTFAIMFGISALPAVTSAWAVNDMTAMRRNVNSVLKITTLFTVPAGLGLSFLARPILNLLFSGRPQEVAVATPLLNILGFAVILVAICVPIDSMLQAIGRPDLPVKFLLIGASIKLTLNYIIIAIPSINIKGAAISTLVCYIVIITLSFTALCRNTKIIPNITNVFIKPIFAAALCISSALLTYNILSKILFEKLTTVISLILGVVFYAIILILIKAISKDELLMLPNGKNIANILEKCGWIG
jgi:stage V sporulation protein B